MTLILDGTNGITFPNSSTQSVGFYGFKNRIINGAMMIDQRNAGASVTITTAANLIFPVDRFWPYKDTSGATVTSQRSTTAPAGFINSLLVSVTTGSTAAPTDQNFIQHGIEGLNLADMGWGTASAQSFTVSFWVRGSVTGTYGIGFSNSAANRCYVGTYAINSANTWEYKTITVPGDTSGTWLTTNGMGLRIRIDYGSGTSYQIAAGSWGSSFGNTVSGRANVVGTTGATFYITGVQLEKGSTATSFDYRPYGTELALCQRYYVKYANSGTGFLGITGQVSGTSGSYFLFPISMRATPTPGFSNINSNDTSVNNAVSSIGVDSNTTNCVRATFNCSSNTLTVGRAALIYTASNGYIDFSAEL